MLRHSTVLLSALTTAVFCAAVTNASADYTTDSSTAGTSKATDNWQSGQDDTRSGPGQTRSRNDYMERGRSVQDTRDMRGTQHAQTDRSTSGFSSTDDTRDERFSRNLGGQNSRTTGDSLLEDSRQNDTSARSSMRRQQSSTGRTSDALHQGGSNPGSSSDAERTSSNVGSGSTAGSATGSTSTR